MEPFKNVFNPKSAAAIAEAIRREFPDFPSRAFLREIGAELEKRELKDRVRFLAERLRRFLPEAEDRALPILVGALRKGGNDPVGLEGFLVWPLTEFVSRYGLAAPALSLEALKAMTKVFTAEWANEAPLSKARRKLIRHSVRTLVKKGDLAALRLIGIDPKGIRLVDFRLKEKTFGMGEPAAARVTLRNRTRKSLVAIVDHELRLLGSRGRHRTKVFKGRRVSLAPGETRDLVVKLRAVTVRKYYEGEQFWAVLVNGTRSEALRFRLRTKPTGKRRKPTKNARA